MARISVSRVVEAAPAVVWDDLRDLSSHVTWMADAESITFEGHQREGVGTRFECRTRVGVPGGATEVTWTESLTFPGRLGGRAGAWVGGMVLRAIWARNLAALQRRIERQAA